MCVCMCADVKGDVKNIIVFMELDWLFFYHLLIVKHKELVIWDWTCIMMELKFHFEMWTVCKIRICSIMGRLNKQTKKKRSAYVKCVKRYIVIIWKSTEVKNCKCLAVLKLRAGNYKSWKRTGVDTSIFAIH